MKWTLGTNSGILIVHDPCSTSRFQDALSGAKQEIEPAQSDERDHARTEDKMGVERDP